MPVASAPMCGLPTAPKPRYEYDADTFRLTRLLTTRDNGADVLQDIAYTYDPEGNIVQQTDAAQQTFYFSNSVVAPTGLYEYDALYRLTKAEGRELTSLGMATDTDFANNLAVPNPAANAMQNYTQLFTYDELGNIQTMQSQGRWTRNYEYDTATNRLLRHEGSTNVYAYDAHGNMTAMPHLTAMQWDWNDRLRCTTNGTVTTWYCYDAAGNRVRKVTEKPGGVTQERVYLGNYEVYTHKIGSTTHTLRETIHLTDNRHRFALVDKLKIDNGVTLPTAAFTTRYQHSNHLGSASLELNQKAAIISYEEYHPFGTTSYRSGRTETEVAQKLYKYVGKERDEETGLYYYGARYYAAWLARFVSVDPLQFKYPHYTPYQYAGNKPVSYIDLDGLEEKKKEETKEPQKGKQTKGNTPQSQSIPPKIDLSKDNWYEQAVALFKWIKDNRNTLPSNIPIDSVVDFTKFPNKNFSLNSTFFGDQYTSKNKLDLPQMVVQTSNLRMNVIKEIYMINRSNLNITSKTVVNQKDSTIEKKYSFKGMHEGIITVMIPTTNPISKSPQIKGIQLNFDISNEKQYRLFINLFIDLNGIYEYKKYNYIKLKKDE
ncbi:MAG: hypothetical protein PHU33_14525 [Bacteroidales bacterium]|nr:hypothetical protein [Bacteroidales bacterium]